MALHGFDQSSRACCRGADVSYPIKTELNKAHRLLCQATTCLVFQIVVKRYKPSDTREALVKATEAVHVLKNLIDRAT